MYRGGSVAWEGRLLEPVPSAAGWTVSATGAGTLGADFSAIYSNWSNPDDAIGQAIARGLRWSNPAPGLSGSPYASMLWLGQQVDSGSQQITDYLNAITVQGALIWWIGRNNVLSVMPRPTAVNRLLVATTPVPRTVASDLTTLWLHYQATADTTSTTGGATATATFGLAEATLPESIAAHGPLEAYADISSAGVMSSGQATANGNAILAQYNRANYSGTFAVRYGQLLTTGGTPVDLGCQMDQPMVCRLLLTDAGYGGEVIAGPIQFLAGAYAYDDHAQIASITPFQAVSADLSSLLSAMYPTTSTAS